MPITNPQQIRYCNEQIRPLAEALRAFKARGDAALVEWYAGLNTIPNDPAEIVEDGREAEGVSRLTGADIHNFMYLLAVRVADMNDATIQKPCVRPLQVG